MSTIIPAAEAIQGGEKWFSLRCGIPTASEFKNILTPDFTLKEAKKKGEINAAVWTYLCKKLAEKWSGQPLPQFQGTWEMEEGKRREVLARKWIALTYDDWDVKEVAFIKSGDEKSGCSPDGVINGNMGLELKCLEAPHHIECVLEGTLPDDYRHQVHGSLYVSGFPRWTLCLYRQDFPALVFTVERDETIIARIDAAIKQFTALLEGAFEKLKKIP